MSAIVADAKRFVFFNRHMIEEAPLQVYLSAIVFAPSGSMMRQNFVRELPGWLSQLPIVSDDWGDEFLMPEGHEYKVEAVVFSPDGSLIASASSDTKVRL